METIALILIGIFTGTITSLIGSSGVMIIVPLLSMFFGLSIHMAIGTSLMVDVIASITVAYNYYKNGNVDLKPGMWIAIGSLGGSQVGAIWASHMSEGNLGSSFGIILILSGVFMFRNKREGKKSLLEKIQGHIQFNAEWKKTVTALLIGFFIGIMSGVFGAGGGVMILLALIIILSFPLHKAIGTSTLIMTITAFSAASGYALRDNIDTIIGLIIGSGSILGGILGSHYANKVNEKMLKKIVGGVFFAMGIIMILIKQCTI